MKIRSRLACVASFFVLLLVISAQAEDRNLTFDDFGEVSSPASALISSDGKWLSYVFEDRIYAYSFESADSRPLTSGEFSAWGNRWSVDDDYVQYLVDTGDGARLFRTPPGEPSEAQQLALFPAEVSSNKLSPDGSRVLLGISDNDLKPNADDDEPRPIVITHRNFKTDRGLGYVLEGDTEHVRLYDMEKCGESHRGRRKRGMPPGHPRAIPSFM